ncbi:hypothetical protein QBC39DRAFT_371333 [Podospora conica]|nr:hypothetical protein QBC39DRAFT_371333 [Schizothecium conicum]
MANNSHTFATMPRDEPEDQTIYPQEYAPLDPSDDGHPKGDGSPGEPWAAGVWERFPWQPFLNALVTILCAVACVVVLRLSDGANTDDWSVRPSVLVSIFTAVGNASLRYAVGEGFQMAWWSKATATPRTVGRLHEYYAHGTSVLAAGLSLRKPSFIALATLLASILAIDGPLLQRASSTRLVERQVPSTPVTITLGTQMPFGYTGKEFAGDSVALSTRPLVNPGFATVFSEYSQRVPISAAAVAPGQCIGVCEGEIEAMGLWKTCTSSEEIIVAPGMNISRAFVNRTLFLVDIFHQTQYSPINTLDRTHTKIAEDSPSNSRDPPEDVPYIALNITYSPLPANGTRRVGRHVCRLYSARRRYPVRITNDTTPGEGALLSSGDQAGGILSLTDSSTFIEDSIQNVRHAVTSLGLPPTTEGPGPIQPYHLSLTTLPYFFPDLSCSGLYLCPMQSTLGGLSSAVQDVLSANIRSSPGDIDYVVTMQGSLPNQLIKESPTVGFNNTLAFTGIPVQNPVLTRIGWDDPTDLIMAAFDEIMLRTAVATAHLDVLQNVTWMYANSNRNTVPAPARNGSDAERYRLMPAAQTVNMSQKRTIQVFVSNYAFLAAGVAVMLVAVVGVLPLFYGFWALGRNVTLSPIETAKAFGAPVLDTEGVSSNATATAIAKSETGRLLVRYGEVSGSEERGGVRLRFGAAASVREPMSGRVYE